MEKPKNSPQLQALLKVVSGKLGIPAETLQSELEAGRYDQAIAAMRPADAAAFQQVLANPQRLNQIMSSKQARALYEKLTGR
ncbi:MAG: hypothetical protein K6E36_01290 [Oscillospiraceae bacterium]|nr:hypothetical protein [Oscillospiraceae bacterium]MCR5305122.1 hypothetical protein [Oscillospiraceae bacterium]